MHSLALIKLKLRTIKKLAKTDRTFRYLKDVRFHLIPNLLVLILILFTITIVYSCKTSKSELLENIPIAENIHEASLLKLSDYAVNIEYIILETTEDILLTGNERIAVSPDYFILFSEECLIFDRKGKFVQKIGNKGRGPGEYVNAYGSYLYPGNQLIYFPYTAYESILVFSQENRLVGECNQSKHRGGDLRSINNELFVKYRHFQQGDSEWNILVFNCNGDSISCIKNNYKYDGISRFGYIDECEFYYYNNELHLKEAYSDTIFKFNNDGQHIPKYTLNLDKYTVPPTIREDFEVFRNTFTRDFFAVRGLYETDSYLIFKYFHNREESIMIYNKRTNELENFISKEYFRGIENDFDGGPYFFPDFNDNDLFIQIINSYKLKEYVASETFKDSTPRHLEKKKELEELAASLDESDNPVLMLIQLKQ